MKTIWIDAGHGGKDSGAINKNLQLYEKDLTLKLALELEKCLKKQGINTVLTRSDDKTINYISRYKLENDNNCSLALSLHLNSCLKENTATGTEIWVHSNAFPQTIKFGEDLLDEISKVSCFKKRGVKKGYPSNQAANFWCNRLTNSMSALVEVCFINNDSDARKFLEDYKKYALAISKVCRKILGI